MFGSSLIPGPTFLDLNGTIIIASIPGALVKSVYQDSRDCIREIFQAIYLTQGITMHLMQLWAFKLVIIIN